MKNNSAKRLEVLLWLAVRQLSVSEIGANTADETPDSQESSGKIDETKLPVLFKQLNKGETEKLKSLLADYNNKNAAEQENWKKNMRAFVGSDNGFLEESLHWSHIGEALKKEPPAIRKIIYEALPKSDREPLKSVLEFEKDAASKSEIKQKDTFNLVSKAIQRAFARQFKTLSDLQKPTAFDRLDGTQMVRLIRLAGIREVTFACARIEAVETVAAFLKRFPAEAARAIAAQLNNLPRISDERLSFAENLVQNALEIEPQPSAMLDLLGIWLIGIRICNSPSARIVYTQQKLPREFAPELPEIIENQCKKTPAGLQKEVSAEIEQLAETIIKTTKSDNRNLRSRKETE